MMTTYRSADSIRGTGKRPRSAQAETSFRVIRLPAIRVITTNGNPIRAPAYEPTNTQKFFHPPGLSCRRSTSLAARSATSQSIQVFRVASSLHSDLRDGFINFAEIVRRQFHINCSNVLLQAVLLRSARNRHDPRLLGKNPGKRDSSGRRILSRCDLSD